MEVDILTGTVINCPKDKVTAFAGDPDNAPKWYVNIKSVEWKTDPPVRLGSKIAFVAHFLGRRLAYTYEITEFIPGEKMVMRTAQGPFPMETTYTWESSGESKTRMTLRNHGKPSGFAMVAALLMPIAMKRANRKDLARLKGIMEGSIGI
jgi:uncharacterized membrane protein